MLVAQALLLLSQREEEGLLGEICRKALLNSLDYCESSENGGPTVDAEMI